jgi:hypothetical protein
VYFTRFKVKNWHIARPHLPYVKGGRGLLTDRLCVPMRLRSFSHIGVGIFSAALLRWHPKSLESRECLPAIGLDDAIV